MTPSATQSEKIAGNNENSDQADAQGNWSTVSGNNSSLNGAITATPYYQNEVQAGTNATTQGYNASARNAKQQMEAAGVSGNSGVAAGNATALDAKEASDLGTVKTNAYADTEKQQLAANAQDLTAAGQQGGEGVQYAGINNKDAQERQKQGVASTSALTSAITKAAFA